MAAGVSATIAPFQQVRFSEDHKTVLEIEIYALHQLRSLMVFRMNVRLVHTELKTPGFPQPQE